MRHLIISVLAIASLSAEDGPSTFSSIKPLLETACVCCHGPDKAKGGLRVDGVEAVLKGGKKMGAGVVAGKPDESPLLKVLTMERRQRLAMPPEGSGDPLTKEEIALVRKWITDGARP
jgi:mono/diheme cytochrome c family protein